MLFFLVKVVTLPTDLLLNKENLPNYPTLILIYPSNNLNKSTVYLSKKVHSSLTKREIIKNQNNPKNLQAITTIINFQIHNLYVKNLIPLPLPLLTASLHPNNPSVLNNLSMMNSVCQASNVILMMKILQ